MKKGIVVLLTVIQWILASIMPTIMYIYTIYAAYKMFLDSIVAAIIAACLPVLSTIVMFILQFRAFGFIGFCSNICIFFVLGIVFLLIGLGLGMLNEKIMD